MNTLQFSAIVTFEHKHEDKSCSACRERVNERMRESESVRVCSTNISFLMSCSHIENEKQKE